MTKRQKGVRAEEYDETMRLRKLGKDNWHKFHALYEEVYNELIAKITTEERKALCNKIMKLLDRLDKIVYKEVHNNKVLDIPDSVNIFLDNEDDEDYNS